jgi:hypothetical protein
MLLSALIICGLISIGSFVLTKKTNGVGYGCFFGGLTALSGAVTIIFGIVLLLGG